MKKFRNVLGFVLMYLGAWIQGMKYILIAALILSVIFTSCKTNGYGCKGKESWNGMVKRINRQ